GNDRILVDRVHGRASVVSVRDDDSSSKRISYQQERRKLVPGVDPSSILLDMRIADAKQGQTGRPENVLGLELGGGCAFQSRDLPFGRPFVIQKAQVRERGGIVVRFGREQPLDLSWFRHGLFIVCLVSMRICALRSRAPDAGTAPTPMGPAAR